MQNDKELIERIEQAQCLADCFGFVQTAQALEKLLVAEKTIAEAQKLAIQPKDVWIS